MRTVEFHGLAGSAWPQLKLLAERPPSFCLSIHSLAHLNKEHVECSPDCWEYNLHVVPAIQGSGAQSGSGAGV